MRLIRQSASPVEWNLPISSYEMKSIYAPRLLIIQFSLGEAAYRALLLVKARSEFSRPCHGAASNLVGR